MGTQLRYMISKDIDRLIMVVGRLPFKIEIKGQPMLLDDGWHIFFTIDENDPRAMKYKSGMIDVG